jgi:hypothetical protein
MALDLAGGWQIFGLFLIIFTVGLIFTLYTRRGSGITQRPYGDVYGGAPGARGSSVLHHDESAATRYTRGTRSRVSAAARQRKVHAGRPVSVEAAKIFTRS